MKKYDNIRKSPFLSGVLIIALMVVMMPVEKPEVQAKATAISLPVGVKITQVSCAANFSIALDSSGKVWSWGVNDYGQLGRDTGTEMCSAVPAQVKNLPEKAVYITCGPNTAAAITESGNIYMWGWNKGLFGDKEALSDSQVPVRVMGPWVQEEKKMQSLTLGIGAHTIDEDGVVYSWGANQNTGENQMGRSDVTDCSLQEPAKMDFTWGGSNVAAQVVEIGASVAIITKTGDLYTWGPNNWGQLGRKTKKRTDDEAYVASGTPWKVGISNVVTVSGGGNAVIALTSDNKVYTWGQLIAGNLGRTDIENYKADCIPHQVSGLPDGVSFTDANALGQWACVVLTESGDIYSWGCNDNGSLGRDTEGEDSASPGKALVTGIQQLDCGYNHNVGIDRVGNLYTWGSARGVGALGTGEISGFSFEPQMIMKVTESSEATPTPSASLTPEPLAPATPTPLIAASPTSSADSIPKLSINQRSSSATVAVKLAKAEIKKVKSGKKKFTVTAKKKASSYGGFKFQIGYRMGGRTKWKYTTTSFKTTTIKKLKKGRKYTIRIRAYKEVNGKTYYGKWSKIKVVKVK